MNGYLVLKTWACFFLALPQLFYGLKQGLLAAMAVKGYKLTFEHSSEIVQSSLKIKSNFQEGQK